MSDEYIEEMNIFDFEDEIAIRLELDLSKNILNLVEEVINIVEKKKQTLEVCEKCEDKLITLNRLSTKNLNNVKEIVCYYIEINNKKNMEECSYFVFDDYETAKEYYNKYATKTMEDWHESKAENFDQFFKPGDIVSKEIVDVFLNSVPPITEHTDFIQAGEAYDTAFDKEDNKLKNTYTTFEKEGDDWIYKGNCFKGKNVEPSYVENEFEIVPNLEDFDDFRLLLKDNETVASLKKNNYLIELQVNGDVEIEDKKGQYIPLYDEKLKQSIKDGNFQDNYNIVSNNWLEISYYKKNENGQYEYLNYEMDVYASVYELGDNIKEIEKCLEEWLDDFIEEDEQEDVLE